MYTFPKKPKVIKGIVNYRLSKIPYFISRKKAYFKERVPGDSLARKTPRKPGCFYTGASFKKDPYTNSHMKKLLWVNRVS